MVSVYTGRSSTGSGGANGRIGDYEVYASADVSTIDGEWGDAVAAGTFANAAQAQMVGFPAQTARYLKLVALSEVNGNPWATIGELAAAGPAAEAPTYEASVSLDRAPGGLKSVRRARDGSEQTWTVLGASRGEGGILGEGVRQALLRDPTYRPALSCAQVFAR